MKKKISLMFMSALLTAGTSSLSALAAPTAQELRQEQARTQHSKELNRRKAKECLSRLKKLQEELIETGVERQRLSQELKQKRNEATKLSELMSARVVHQYEKEGNDLEYIFLNSKTMSDIVNKAHFTILIRTEEQKQWKQLKRLCNEIEQKEKELSARYLEMTQAQKKLELEKKRYDQMVVDYELKEQEVNNLLEEVLAEEAENKKQDLFYTPNLTKPQSKFPVKNKPVSEDEKEEQKDENIFDIIVAAANSQLGVPYVWGGTSPGSGLDCSGLVQYCYRRAGISLPRVSQSQGCCGKSTNNPQPGDIVCYGSHIGIFLERGKMIHAPQPGEVVKISKIYGNPWYRTFR